MQDTVYSIAWLLFPSLSYYYYSWFESVLCLCFVYFLINIFPKFFGLHPMSSLDSLMFYETETNKLNVTSIGIFSEKITIGQYKSCFLRGLPKDPKLTSIVTTILGRYYWKSDPAFNLDNHFILHSEQVSKEDLEDFMSEISSKSLDMTRPLYQLHLFENFEATSAVVFRFHHSIADGLSIGSFILWCADEGSCKKLYSPKGLGVFKRLVLIFVTSLTSVYFLIKFMMKKTDVNPLHKEKLSGQKTICWSDKIRLKGIFKHCKDQKITFNDFLTAYVLQTLQEYAGCNLGTITANIPVSLVGQPEDGSFMKLENNLVVVTVEFPEVSDALPTQCSKIFNQLKNSIDPYVSFYSVQLGISVLPKFIMKNLVFFLVNKATLVFSNAGGPREPVYYSGKKFDRIIPNSPNMANSGISVTAFSYTDHFTIICYADKNVMQDSKRFLKILSAKLEKVNEKHLD